MKVLFDRFAWKVAMVLLASIIAGFLMIGVLLVELKTDNSIASAPQTETSLPSTNGWSFLLSRKFYLFTYTVFGMS
jgi:hypothetical protein